MPETRAGRRAATILVAALALVAYLPSLSGGFVSDDARFIGDNEAVHHLSLRTAAGFFTDPATEATQGHDIYRPLRALDFAIDWAIAGDRPWFFRLHNLLYHVLGALLVLALFRRLAGEDAGAGVASAAAAGAMLFAVHPVLTESVAFVSSRADLLCIVLFLSALLLHLSGRPVLAALVLVPALFAKEVAAVFPAAVLLADWYLRRRKPWRWYAVYALLAVAFTALWFRLVAGNDPGQVAQIQAWPGGSWGMNLLTVGKGFLYDLKVLVFPVDLVFDWHVPSHRVLTAPDLLFAAAGFAAVAGAIAAGRKSRFAGLWFLVTILPVSGILWPMLIPTADRFLLLPAVGFTFFAGTLLVRTRLRWLVLALFLALTVNRSLVWRSPDALWGATNARAVTPNGLAVKSWHEIERALDHLNPRSPSPENRAAAEEVVATVDRFFALYRDDIQLTPTDPGGDLLVPRKTGALMLTRKAQALCVLGRLREALDAAGHAVGLDERSPRAHEAAGVAYAKLGRPVEAAEAQQRAVQNGLDDPASLRRLTDLLTVAGRMKEKQGDKAAALGYYRRAVAATPGTRYSEPAARAIERLTR